MREQALHAALDEMTAWLDLASSQVAVFDATNSTEDRRNKLVRMLYCAEVEGCLSRGYATWSSSMCGSHSQLASTTQSSAGLAHL